MEVATLYPDRITVRNVNESRFGDASLRIVNRLFNEKSKKNLKVNKQSFKLSQTSKRLIKDSYCLLYELAPPRQVKVNDDTTIYNFRTSFITLTLPSKQIHSDVEVKKCLNHFLTDIRRHLDVNNYVWKAELQKNKNIHFHITIDKFCTYNAIRFYWNRAINKLGYVDRYSQKFSKMSLLEYARYRGLKVEECKEVYFKGVSNNWQIPNSVDVKAVRNDKALKNYLAKYISKDNDDLQDDDRARYFGKVWSRSQSLSKIKLIKSWLWSDIKSIIGNHLADSKQFYKSSNDWCTVYYFSFSRLSLDIKSILKGILTRQANYFDYVYPT